MDATKQNDLFTDIARRILSIDTLEPRNMDDLDFHEVSIQSVAKALQAAYDAGHSAAFDEMPDDEGMYGVDAYDLMRFAKAYSGLGSAIQDQLDDILDSNFSDINGNAVVEMERHLRGMNEEIDDALDAYADECDGDEDDAETC